MPPSLGAFSVLHAFNGSDGDPFRLSGSLVVGPDGGLYGTATAGGKPGPDCVIGLFGISGGSIGCGVVFRFATDGTFTVLHEFSESEGSYSYFPTSLVVDGHSNLFGITIGGGGEIYRIAPSGEFTILHTFDRDGANGTALFDPVSLTLAPDGSLHGAALLGGAGNNGGVFQLSPDGKYSSLYSFPTAVGTQQCCLQRAGVTEGAGGQLYGWTSAQYCDPTAGCGTLFKIDPHGVYSLLHVFMQGSDDSSPSGLLSDQVGNLYGTAQPATTSPGQAGSGAVFELPVDGTYGIFHDFSADVLIGTPGSLVRGSQGDFFGLGSGQTFGGSIFRLDQDGKASLLYTFSGEDAASDRATTLISDGSNLYGLATGEGGQPPTPNGYLFRFTPDQP